MTNELAIARFKRLPQRSDDVWQGGLVRLPMWIEQGPDGRPYRPWAGIWVSEKTGFVHFKTEAQAGAPDHALALDTLIEFALKPRLAGYRPARLRVSDEDLGRHLTGTLGNDEFAVTTVPDLPEVRRVLADMSQHLNGRPPVPGALDAAGVTPDRMHAFAAAAADFYRAAPWRLLCGDDLIHVEAPGAARGLAYLTVLGAGGQTFGLGFFDSETDYDEMETAQSPDAFLDEARWSLFFGAISDLPFGDADLWERHDLPVAGERAYPIAIQFDRRRTPRRPDAGTLAYLEGLLRALGGTGEDEMDHGCWSRSVETYDGAAAYQLCIPALLEPLDAPPRRLAAERFDRRAMERVMLEMERFAAASQFENVEQINEVMRQRFSGPMETIPSTAVTPLERAQELAYRAFESRGRRQLQLVRKALELSGDCADAYVILAERAPDAAEARDLYAKGVAAGVRALGPRVFAEHAGGFWGIVTTRPYMRARFGLAQCLETLGETDEALGHYRELLRLNPNDNQGVRYSLLPALLRADLDDEAGALLGQFGDEPTALWRYGWALWAFRRDGDGPAARSRLRKALQVNKGAAKYLAGKKELPDDEPSAYGLGTEEEAVICARMWATLWQEIPGALAWVRAALRERKTRKGSRRR